MRKIDEAVAAAIAKKETLSKQNTKIQYVLTNELSIVYLHGHQIAKVDHNKNKVEVCFCGYITNVTRDRINAVLAGAGKNQYFRIKQGKAVLMPDNLAVVASEKVVIV